MIDLVVQALSSPAAQLVVLIIVLLIAGSASTAAFFGRKFFGVFQSQVTNLVEKFEEAVDEQHKTNQEIVALRTDVNWLIKAQDEGQQRIQALEQRDRG